MARHHVNPNTGNSSVCKAAVKGCPFGGESGEENHYSSAEEATAAAEKLMADSYSTVKIAYRKKDNSALSNMNRELKKRIINEANEGKNDLHPSVVAKVFSKDNDELIRRNVAQKFKSQKILREMSNDESAKVRLSVAQMTKNPKVLAGLAEDEDPNVRKAAAKNPNIPVKAKKVAKDGVKANPVKNESNKASAPIESTPEVKSSIKSVEEISKMADKYEAIANSAETSRKAMNAMTTADVLKSVSRIVKESPPEKLQKNLDSHLKFISTGGEYDKTMQRTVNKVRDMINVNDTKEKGAKTHAQKLASSPSPAPSKSTSDSDRKQKQSLILTRNIARTAALELDMSNVRGQKFFVNEEAITILTNVTGNDNSEMMNEKEADAYMDALIKDPKAPSYIKESVEIAKQNLIW